MKFETSIVSYVLLILVLFRTSHSLRINSLIELQKDSSSITIEWAVSSKSQAINDTESDWIGFKIKYFTDKLQYTPILLKNILFRKFRLDNLKPNTEYKVQVSAYDSAGNEGPASRLLIVRTYETVPGEPQDFKLVKVTSDSIELEWKPPRSDDSGATSNVKGYEIHYFKVIDASYSDPSVQAHETQIFKIKLPYRKLKHKLNKLEPNSLYKIQIFAYNMKGDGQRSNQLLVQTMDEGPNKPENIRSEIYNNLLHIKWSPPSLKSGSKLHSSAARQKVAGYRLYFNNEKYEVDDQTTQITFQRPKWEYDRQYDFRIAAKSIQSNNAIYGQEAVFRISTSTNQSKIAIMLEKLTSTSVQIKWNNVSFSSFTDSSSAEYDIGPSASSKSKTTHYKFSYWLKSDPINVITFDELTKNELILKELKPNCDYIIQIVAFGSTRNGPMTSEIALKHFRTLIDDIKVPGNLQVTRVTYDKLNIKWDPVVLYDPNQPSQNFNLIKGYKIFYKEIVPAGSEEVNDYPMQFYDSYGDVASDEWTVIDTINGDVNTEINLEDLNINRDYAIKVAAVDHFDNQGPESDVKIAYSLIDSSNTGQPIFDSTQAAKSYKINMNIGTPRNFKIAESTTSVKLSWKPPAQTTSIKSFLVTYIDQPKEYRETNGTVVSYRSGLAMSIKVPARDDPTMEIYWLVSSLQPDTTYNFNISAVLENGEQGPPITKQIRTRADRPAKVDRPIIVDIYPDNTVMVRTGNASEKNGPIKKYWLVVVPIDSNTNADKQQNQINYETRERNIKKLLEYSIYDENNRQEYANGSSYIAAEFQAAHWPARFILGDGRLYGRFFNRRLLKTFEYQAYIVAFTDQQANPNNPSSLNRLDLGDIIQNVNALRESDLYTASMYSDVFGIISGIVKIVDTKETLIGGMRIKDPQALLWSFGLIISAMLILFILCGVHLKGRKKSAASFQSNPISMNGRTANSSTMSSNLNGRQMDTQATLKNGAVMTNTLKIGGITKHTIDLNEMNTSGMGNESNNLGATVSSSSSSSLTTTSPTTALLNCSTNNTNNNSQTSSNTQALPMNSNLLHNNGLLTTASPMRTAQMMINNTSSPITNQLIANNNSNNPESLYTSIEATQKLLQQQLLTNSATSNPYDNNNQQIMMMMLNGQSTFGVATSGTLTRNGHMNNTLNQQQYDPVELRRIQYQTPAMQLHPPVIIDEFFQHVDRLKAQNNAQFSAEYESIEPGQQFQWENSTIEFNRQKNRYANVIAYDHSRVVLIKLPEQHFQAISSQSNYGTLGGNNTLTRNYGHNTEMNYYGTLRGGTGGSIGMEHTPPLPPPPPPPPGQTQSAPPAIQATTSDYINANFIDGYRKRNAYIATQGPMPSTICDFWRMVWEQQTCSIVMLTKLEERNRLKCDQYWPNKGTEVYGSCVQVTLVDTTELSAYTIRTFVITPVGQYAQIQIANNTQNINYELRREVKQYQYTAWPDHGVPEHPTPFLMFARRVRAANPIDSGPIIAHCSAGVGRTGCYIVIDTILEKIKHDRFIDIYGYVTCLRSQRNYMVQTEEQYIFCYDSIVEALHGGNTEVPARQLYAHLQRLLQLSPEDPNGMLTEMELEYKRLSNIKAPQSKFQSANLASNKFKNRLVNILPYEATRVTLQPLANAPEGSDYINANFIDGYKYKRAYIATQAPLNETVDDFWRMLWEHNSTIIVMLTKLREMGREKCAQYWPSERSIRYQYFVVDPIAEYNMAQYILREFKVTDARDGQSRTIRQFQFVDWPEQGVPKSGESIIELIGQVHKTKEQFGQTGPITVHCSAGVGRTGVFISLGIVLERTRFEGMIDVFNTVKVLRTQRPAMVQTEDQYQFCYRAALEYIGSYDSYE